MHIGVGRAFAHCFQHLLELPGADALSGRTDYVGRGHGPCHLARGRTCRRACGARVAGGPTQPDGDTPVDAHAAEVDMGLCDRPLEILVAELVVERRSSRLIFTLKSPLPVVESAIGISWKPSRSASKERFPPSAWARSWGPGSARNTTAPASRATRKLFMPHLLFVQHAPVVHRSRGTRSTSPANLRIWVQSVRGLSLTIWFEDSKRRNCGGLPTKGSRPAPCG